MCNPKKVVIVDDEEYIRERLKRRIPWESLGLVVAGEASNGREAYECVKEIHPHIIITDMKMPGWEGTRLLDILEDKFPDIIKIVISGYSDYEYMRYAVKYNATDYILKPFDNEQVVTALKKACEKLNYCRADINDSIKEKLSENANIIKGSYLNNIINSDITDSREYLMCSQDVFNTNQKVAKSLVATCYIFHNVTGNSLLNNFSISELQDKIWPLWKKNNEVTLIDAHFFRNYRHVDELVILFALSCELNERKVRDTIYEVFELLKNFIKDDGRIYMGAGNIYEGLNHVAKSYSEAQSALHSLEHGSSGIRFYLEESSYVEIFNHERLHSLISKIEDCDFIKASSIIKNCMDLFIIKRGYTIKVIKKNLMHILLAFDKLLQNYNSSINEVNIDSYKEDLLAATLWKNDQLGDWLKIVVAQIISIIEGKLGKSGQSIIKDAIDYLIKNYHTEISVQNLSQKYHMNQSYFCQLFKKSTGETIVDFLTKLRIEKAKKLLEDEEMPISRIVTAIGFNDAKYFSKVFKKYVNITPNDYRKNSAQEKLKLQNSLRL